MKRIKMTELIAILLTLPCYFIITNLQCYFIIKNLLCYYASIIFFFLIGVNCLKDERENFFKFLR